MDCYFKKVIFSLVVINENMEVVSVTAYPTKKTALEAIKEDYERTKQMLEAEGWDEDELSVDEFEISHYWIEYGESSYYAEIKETDLYE